MSRLQELREDGPVFDPQCPSCGRFYKMPVRYWINGADEVTRVEVECSRCGTVSPRIVCWRSDLEGIRG